jgi:replicative DNA helicase
MVEESSVNETTSKKVWLLVDRWLEVHKGERFDLDTICRHLEITQRENRHHVVKKLSYEVSRGVLEKSDRIYRTIDSTLVNIDWVNATDAEVLPIRWPYGHEDATMFGFDGNVHISPGDLIVVAGVSNTGKTSFCLNLLWDG